MYLFFNQGREVFIMGKRRGSAINIDTKGGWTPDEGGDKRKKWERNGKERKGMLLPGKYHKGEKEREF